MRGFAFAVCLAAGMSAVHAAAPAVGSVTVTDDNGMVTVNYTLQNAPAVITFDATTNGAPIDAACFSSATGDVFRLVSAASGSFVWRPANDIPLFNIAGADLKVRVKAWDVDAPPDYMVVSLATNATVSVSVAYYECEAQLPGRITDPVYKTSKLVMRKIPAAGVTWRMGSPSSELGREWGSGAIETLHYVTLTEDFYLGVYPLTGGQWNYMNGGSGNGRAPVGVNTMDALRGTGASDKRWPGDGHEVSNTGSLIYKVRAYTGIDFDAPTEAQWEFACRAGESAALSNTGKELSANESCDEADEAAWHRHNYTGTISNWQSYMEVGQKKPNAYGLYDMLGNAWEFCLDRYQQNLGPNAVTDPKGATSGDNYVKRGGAVDSYAYFCRAAARSYAAKSAWADNWSGNRNTSVRLWAAARAVK